MTRDCLLLVSLSTVFSFCLICKWLIIELVVLWYAGLTLYRLHFIWIYLWCTMCMCVYILIYILYLYHSFGQEMDTAVLRQQWQYCWPSIRLPKGSMPQWSTLATTQMDTKSRVSSLTNSLWTLKSCCDTWSLHPVERFHWTYVWPDDKVRSLCKKRGHHMMGCSGLNARLLHA